MKAVCFSCDFQPRPGPLEQLEVYARVSPSHQSCPSIAKAGIALSLSSVWAFPLLIGSSPAKLSFIPASGVLEEASRGGKLWAGATCPKPTVQPTNNQVTPILDFFVVFAREKLPALPPQPTNEPAAIHFGVRTVHRTSTWPSVPKTPPPQKKRARADMSPSPKRRGSTAIRTGKFPF